jgi:hypothetical protein
MARHTDVVRRHGGAVHRSHVESRAARRAELFALAVAGLAGTMVHGGLPSLGGPTRRGSAAQRRRTVRAA